MKLLGVSGSLRATSTNTRLLEALKQLMPVNVTFTIEPSLADLPLFNPELPIDANDALPGFVERFRESDGIVFSSPVYAGGYPGVLKNGLDWLVGTDAFVEKPFVMLSASNRMPFVEQTLVTVLETMSGVHVQDASTTVPLLGRSLSVQEIVEDQDLSGTIRAVAERFIAAIDISAAE